MRGTGNSSTSSKLREANAHRAPLQSLTSGKAFSEGECDTRYSAEQHAQRRSLRCGNSAHRSSKPSNGNPNTDCAHQGRRTRTKIDREKLRRTPARCGQRRVRNTANSRNIETHQIRSVESQRTHGE